MKYLVLILILQACALEGSKDQTHSILYYTHKRIFTGETGKFHTALGVKGERIFFIGDKRDIPKGAKIKKLKGELLLPSFVDSHIHIIDLARRGKSKCLLSDNITSKKVLRIEIKTCLAKNSYLNTLVIDNWRPAKFPLHETHREFLDSLTTKKNIIMRSSDGFHFAANTPVLEVVLNKNIKKDELQRSFESRNNKLTGYFNDHGLQYLTTFYSELFPKPSTEDLYEIIGKLNSFGITSILEAYVDFSQVDLFKKLAKRSKNKIDINLAIHPYISKKNEIPSMLEKLVRLRSELKKLSGIDFNTIKLILDGGLEGNPYQKPPRLPSASVLKPYKPASINVEAGQEIISYKHTNQHSHSRGIPYWKQSTLNEFVKVLDEARFITHTHTIGDGSLRQIRKAIEFSKNQVKGHTIAHMQYSNIKDVERLGAMGTSAVFTPLWLNRDLAYDKKVIPFIKKVDSLNRIYSDKNLNEKFYPISDFRKNGGTVLIGSDSPFDYPTPDPFLNISSALKSSQGDKPAFDIHQIIKAITSKVPSLSGQKNRSLEVGATADFIVLNQDLFRLSEKNLFKEIEKTKVLKTFFHGEEVYSLVD
ncbi:MAG: hypothetical protein CME65_11515 [Halobacteriovoraceae bacterium]|nr:hypothetical protein [Halobacteriovoraceae bacterium]|tara:strand:- start:4236 stop:6005 length:1770 start_codon:yes stop_codon:yes gene_type:complete